MADRDPRDPDQFSALLPAHQAVNLNNDEFYTRSVDFHLQDQ